MKKISILFILVCVVLFFSSTFGQKAFYRFLASFKSSPGRITAPLSPSSQSEGTDNSARKKRQVMQRHPRVRVKSLPKNLNTGIEEKASNNIMLKAGDNGASKQVLQAANQLIQNISWPVLQENIGLTPVQTIDIVFFSTERGYANALLKAGIAPGEVPAIVANTGGITVDSDIWIPQYALQDKSQLANVLTHELTHVFFNQAGNGEKLPTWINEGTAWYNGLAAQEKVSPAETKAEILAERADVKNAAQTGHLLPLSASEQDILKASYNVEFEDFMATESLIQRYGIGQFKTFLNLTTRQNVNQSFNTVFEMTLPAYENSFLKSLH